MPEKIDWLAAISYAQLVLLAEQVAPQAQCGQQLEVTLGGGESRSFHVLTTIFADDLATDRRRHDPRLTVSIGFVAQDAEGEVVIAIRGTHGIYERLEDCHYHAVECPILPDSGETEDGFTDVYLSLRTTVGPDGPSLVDALEAIRFPYPVSRVTVCGHSLGAALATLVALDLTVRGKFPELTLYTFASPRLGNARFVEVFQPLLPRAFRIANRADIVTELPPALLNRDNPYTHVEKTFLLVPRGGMSFHIICMHHLTTYLSLMMMEAGLPDGEDMLHPKCCRSEPDHAELLL